MSQISALEARSTMTLNINNSINKARSDDAVAELSSSAVKSESCDLEQHNSAAPPSAGNSSPAIFINLEQQAEKGMFAQLSGLIRKGKLENEETDSEIEILDDDQKSGDESDSQEDPLWQNMIVINSKRKKGDSQKSRKKIHN